LLAPFGDGTPEFDLVFWSVWAGSWPDRLQVRGNRQDRARQNAIKVHLLEIRLFRTTSPAVLGATVRILSRTASTSATTSSPCW
jgi:hypothetical protein